MEVKARLKAVAENQMPGSRTSIEVAFCSYSFKPDASSHLKIFGWAYCVVPFIRRAEENHRAEPSPFGARFVKAGCARRSDTNARTTIKKRISDLAEHVAVRW